MASTHLVIDLEPGVARWRITSPSHPTEAREVPDPFAGGELRSQLEVLRQHASRPISPSTPEGQLAERVLLETARDLGERLTSLLLAPLQRDLLAGLPGTPASGRARVTIAARPRPEPGEDTIIAAQRVDAALALPWELLMPASGEFAVRAGKLDVVREAFVMGAAGLPEPDERLTVAVHVAAPDTQGALRHEEESWRLLGSLHGHDLRFTDLGGRDDLLELLTDDDTPTVIHFSGHGLTGGLLFEDAYGGGELVAVDALTEAIRVCLARQARPKPPPRLFYLASCHGSDSAPSVPAARAEGDGATRDPRLLDDAALGRGPSTAAALHRCGFTQVVAYFGPVGDALSTRAEEVFYRALAKGETTLQAVAEARVAMRDEVEVEGTKLRHPLAWAQLALYHRGDDRPLSQKTSTAPRTVGRFVRKVVKLHGLPVLEVGFIGRRRHLHEVRAMVERQGRRLVVIQGLGGLGKTALATRLLETVLTRARADAFIFDCQSAGSDPAGAMLLRAEEHGQLHALPDWTATCNCLAETHRATVDRMEATVRALRAARPGLVVYADNAESLQQGPAGDDPDALGQWRPEAVAWWEALERLTDEGVVMLSTRYRWPELDPEAVVAIGAMTAADTLKLVATWGRLGELPYAVQRQVSEAVDGHPRTVEFLDGLVRRQQTKLGRKLSEIVDPWKELIAPVLPEGQRRITANLLLDDLWKGLSEDARAHATVLRVLRKAAPEEVLRAVGSANGTSTGALKASGLLTRTTVEVGSGEKRRQEERWGMHPVVVDFVRTKVKGSSETEAHGAVGDAYAARTKQEGAIWGDNEEAVHHLYAAQRPEDAWPLAERYVLHLRQVAAYAMAEAYLLECEEAGTRGDALARLRVMRAQMRGELGDHSEATLALLRDAAGVASTDATRGSIHHELAGALHAQGRFADAEEELRRALDIQKATLGERHPNYAASLHSLAGALHAQARFAEAEAELRRALDIHKATLGERHPDYAASLHEFARALHAQGRFADAEAELRRALDIKKATLGERHPSYAASLHEQARALHAQGRFADAEAELRRALDIVKATLGERHPSYAASLHSLAVALLAQGRFVDAEAELRRALDIKKAMLGEHHPDYAASLHELARALHAQGRFVDAEAELQRALAIQEAIRGAHHPTLAPTLINLATILAEQNRAAEGVPLAERALAIAGRVHGPRHPEVAQILSVQAQLLARLGRPEAPAVAARALTALEQSLGPDHPTTRNVRPRLRAIIDGAVAPPASPEHRALMERLNAAHEAMKARRFPEATAAFRDALAMARTHHDDLGTAAAAFGLAQSLAVSGAHDEARTTAQEAESAAMRSGNADAIRASRQLVAMLTRAPSAMRPPDADARARLEAAAAIMRAGEHAEARAALAAVAARAVNDADVITEAGARGLLAQVLLLQREHDGAAREATRALAIAEQVGDTDAQANFRELLGHIEAARGGGGLGGFAARLGEALTLLQARAYNEAFDVANAVLAEAQAAGDPNGEFVARLTLGQILAAIGQVEVARMEAQRALALARSLRSPDAIGAAQALLDRLPA